MSLHLVYSHVLSCVQRGGVHLQEQPQRRGQNAQDEAPGQLHGEGREGGGGWRHGHGVGEGIGGVVWMVKEWYICIFSNVIESTM